MATLHGRYVLLRQLAEGGLAYIHLAENLDNHGKFALKILKSAAAADRANRKDFYREYRLLAALSHPALPRVYDYGEDQGQPYIAMDYLPGKNLKLWLKKSPVSLHGHLLKVIWESARTLSYLHGKGIVYRDFKPENVLLSESGEVHLVDFALALSRWQRFFSLGRLAQGTPSYLAPEELSGRSRSCLADVYSFGATVYELLTGRPPFIGLSAQEILRQQMAQAPAPPSRFRPVLNPEVDQLVLAMLAKEPGLRPRTIDHAARKLVDLLSDLAAAGKLWEGSAALGG